jgi:hypothetical protein
MAKKVSGSMNWRTTVSRWLTDQAASSSDAFVAPSASIARFFFA